MTNEEIEQRAEVKYKMPDPSQYEEGTLDECYQIDKEVAEYQREAYITGYQQASSEGERLKGLIDEAYRTGYVNRGIYYNYPDKIAKEEYQKSLNAFKVKHNI